ncbi:MAG TPA: ferredoxin reductase family protein [Acidimicrobiales bacterium]|nr:ferredoxin reductase family protein [Acidimicrobiales bacterium]
MPPPPRPRISRRAPEAAAWAAGLGLVAAVALPLAQVNGRSLRAPGGAATLAGDLTAMAGTYLLLIMVLLAARIPGLENALGQDRLIRWHRLLSSAPLVLLGAHVVFTTLGYAQSAHQGLWAESVSLTTTMKWIFASVVAYAMFVVIAGLSIRVARRRFSYDSWWIIHLYTYLALAFSVPHQIFDGTNFAGRPVVQGAWLVLWLGTAGVVVVYRVGLPIYRSVRHQLRVVEVQKEAPGVYSIVVRGRRLDRLAVAGGQFFRWHFLTRGLWWHAHPFSLSAMPVPPYMRVTVKVSGDSTARIAWLRPGTRIAVEGPYGAFTEASRQRRKVALIGAGIGITPVRALLEDLPEGVDAVVVQRASTGDELVHNGEIRSLVKQRGGRLVELVGPRAAHRLSDPRRLHRTIPDLATRDLYICGPESFAAGVVAAAERLGLPAAAIHRESFEF